MELGIVSGSASDGTNAYIFPADAASGAITINIADDDNTAANRVLAAATEADAAEPATNGSYRLSLPAGYTSSSDITVSYTLDGTALIDTDYGVASATTIVLPAFQNSVLLPVTVKDDRIIEGDETVVLTIASGTSAGGDYTASGDATLNIADDDNTAANQVLAVTASQPDAAEPGTDGEFTISLPANITSAEAITVNYAMSGTATAGDDYTEIAGAITIPAGENSVTVPVPVADDDLMEANESVIMTLAGGSSGSFSFTAAASDEATVSIADDENTPANRVLAVTASQAAAAEPGTDGEFTVSLPDGIVTSEDITVNYSITGTAASGTDYTAISGAVIIPAGESSVTVPVAVQDDNIIEADETVVMTITGGSSASFGFTAAASDEATVTIGDDDRTDPAKAVLAVTASLPDAAEPGTDGEFTISLPAGVTSTEAITVNYSVAGSATSGADYTAISGALTIPAGQNGVTVPVIVHDDNIIEVDETVIMTITGGSSASFSLTAGAGEATVTISDDDRTNPAKTLLAVTSSKPAAAEPGTDGEFTVSLPAGVTSSEAITVNYSIAGNAASDADYTAISGSITIPAGENSLIVPVAVTDDNIIEVNETVVMTITGGSSTNFSFAAGAGDEATVTITDDERLDPAKTALSVAASVADAAEPGTDGEFTISLPDGISASEDLVVAYGISGTAAAGTDYAAISGAITIPAGENSVTVSVAVQDDQIIENDETVAMAITGASAASYSLSAGADDNATVTIADDDRAQLVLNAEVLADGAEPGTDGSIHVHLPAGFTLTEDITVNYTVGGTATAGTDYTAITGDITIAAGTNGVEVPVAVLDDKIIETDETVVLTLTGGSSASYTLEVGNNAAAEVTIADDERNDAASKVLAVTASIADAAEPGTDGEFTISLPAGITAAEPVTVSYTVRGTALAGDDYAELSGTVVIPAGQGSVPVPVNVTDDRLIEGDETVELQITGGTTENLGSFGAPAITLFANTAVVTIADNELTAANLQVGIEALSDGSKPSTNGAFRVYLPADVAGQEAVTVQFAVSGTAEAGADYEEIVNITIPAGANSAEVPVEVLDNLTEPERALQITIAGGETNGIDLAAMSGAESATVRILDNRGADLTLVKELTSEGPYIKGESVSYRLEAGNLGPFEAQEVVVTDMLPEELGEPSALQASKGTVRYDNASRTIIWEIDRLLVDEEAVLTFDVEMVAVGTSVTNEASISSEITPDGDPSNNEVSSRPIDEIRDLHIIPNFISPNGDGRNDRFEIRGLENYPNSSLKIFNRLGNEVYSSGNYRNDWTGEGLNEGTYYYILMINKPSGMEQYSGWVFIKR